MVRVPTPRTGRLGIHLHSHQAPIVELSTCATIAPTSAQYPHPRNAITIATAVYATSATRSLAETAVNRIARLRRAECTVPAPYMKIAIDVPMVTGITSAFRKNRASRAPDAANPIVRVNPITHVIQKRLLALDLSISSR